MGEVWVVGLGQIILEAVGVAEADLGDYFQYRYLSPVSLSLFLVLPKTKHPPDLAININTNPPP